MKRQQETYLTKFLYGIQTLFPGQKHTAVGLTWQNHLLRAPHWGCFREAELGRYVLCWKHTNTRALGAFPFLTPPPSLPSVHLDRIVTGVFFAQDGADDVGKIQLLQANGGWDSPAKVCLISTGPGIITPAEKETTLRTQARTRLMVNLENRSSLTQSGVLRVISLHLFPLGT